MPNFSVIEEHYKGNRNRFIKRITSRCGGEWAAADVVQESYYRALKYFSSYKEEFSLDAWFSRILTNTMKEHKNQERGFSHTTYEEDEQEGTPCNRFSEQLVKEIYELIDTKSLVAKEVLSYHFQQGYSAKEVSEITEHSYSNCHQIINRFKSELRELYGKE